MCCCMLHACLHASAVYTIAARSQTSTIRYIYDVRSPVRALSQASNICFRRQDQVLGGTQRVNHSAATSCPETHSHTRTQSQYSCVLPTARTTIYCSSIAVVAQVSVRLCRIVRLPRAVSCTHDHGLGTRALWSGSRALYLPEGRGAYSQPLMWGYKPLLEAHAVRGEGL